MSELTLRAAGVVFDCDGLLLDTEPCWTVAETAVFAARGRTYGPVEKSMFIGKSVFATAELMASIFGEEGNEAAIMEEVLAAVGDVISAHAEPMPGALELVALIAARLPVGVASNSPRAVLDLSLARAGLSGAFGAIVAADEVAHPKPAPDLYREACRQLGVDPAECLAFEDTGTGAAAAHAAGMRVIGVPSPEAAAFVADAVVPSLEDPALRAWALTL